MTTIQQVDFSVDTLQSLLWQYNDATRLQSLLEAKQAWYDANQSAFWTDWYRDVFDLRTANDFGLAIWAIILDLPLAVDLPPSPADYPAFGFGSAFRNFGRGNFGRTQSQNITLTTEQKRLALQLRYFQLTTNGTVFAINRFIGTLFADYGRCWVQVIGTMKYRYVFAFEPSGPLRFIFTQFDLLPRPAGVGVEWIFSTSPHWGFGSNRYNFNRGNFGAG